MTVAGVRHDVPRPFHVLATQNPIEQEGTYPLPEAQLDRFLFEIDVPYPPLDAERRMLFATTGTAEEDAPSRCSPRADLHEDPAPGPPHPGGRAGRRRDPQDRARRASRPRVPMNSSTRTSPGVPRRAPARRLMLGARARALLDGRLSPSIDDVLALAGPVFRHRMALSFTARADGHTVDSVIERLKSAIG